MLSITEFTHSFHPFIPTNTTVFDKRVLRGSAGSESTDLL